MPHTAPAQRSRGGSRIVGKVRSHMPEVKVTELYGVHEGRPVVPAGSHGRPGDMSYNDAWGGTIPFPEEEWDGWCDWWLARHDGDRFHRYLVDAEGGDFVGEVACHYDESGRMHLAGVIVIASRRGRGPSASPRGRGAPACCGTASPRTTPPSRCSSSRASSGQQNRRGHLPPQEPALGTPAAACPLPGPADS